MSGDQAGQDGCPICFEPFTQERLTAVTPCTTVDGVRHHKHRFHKACLPKAFEQAGPSKCPICRQQMDTAFVAKVMNYQPAVQDCVVDVLMAINRARQHQNDAARVGHYQPLASKQWKVITVGLEKIAELGGYDPYLWDWAGIVQQHNDRCATNYYEF